MDLFRKKSALQKELMPANLIRCLSAFDLVLMGVGAVIGAGIFVVTGIVAATQTGPAIVLSYVIAGFACAASALSYAELAASVGGCGSAYGYAYVGFGELIAWIVGWDLILEYTISVSAVSVGWSGYFNDLLRSLGLYLPEQLIRKTGVEEVSFNVLSFSIILFLTGLLALGVKTSSRVNQIIVFIKLTVILMFIVIAATHVNPLNWHPFMPYGWGGVMEGAGLIFFAYIGFDAVSTAAEEAIHPERDLPIGIIGSLLFCTMLYMVVSGLLTGMVHYSLLNVSSPISHALLLMGYRVSAGLIGIGAIAGLTTVMLVLFYGLTRIFFAMSRDGLLPSFFSMVSKKRGSPTRVIVVSGIIMAFISALIPMQELAELVNIGTLAAFMMVSAGVIILRYKKPELSRPFKVPFMPLTPILGFISCGWLVWNLPYVSQLRFVIWMVIGLVIYFFYSRFHSALRH